jgi:KDO2-lipid IV(A) lauroyltransferase
VGASSIDAELWRRLARWGSSRGPEWFVRAAPPVVGLIACALATERRRFVTANLRRVRGEQGALRDAVGVARTFMTYASCLAEILGAGSPRGRLPEALVHGELRLLDAMADGKGLLFVTAHTAGWETVGPLLSRDHGLRVMIAEQAERDARARDIQDAARRAHGVLVAHVGDDPCRRCRSCATCARAASSRSRSTASRPACARATSRSSAHRRASPRGRCASAR